jgi:hypothetical protein
MHITDYTHLFATPDELVDFLMFEAGEQERILTEFAKAGRIDGAEMCCRLDDRTNRNLSTRRTCVGDAHT